MPAPELQREAEELAYRLMFDTRQLRGVDRGLWGNWPTHKAQELDLGAWVERHGLETGETWPDLAQVERSAVGAILRHGKKPRARERQLDLFGEE